MIQARVAFTIVFGLLFVWGVWIWRRAERGSTDAFYARNNVLLSAAFLLTLVPALVWPPDSGMVLLVGSLAVIPFAIVAVSYVRRRREQPDPPQ